MLGVVKEGKKDGDGGFGREEPIGTIKGEEGCCKERLGAMRDGEGGMGVGRTRGERKRRSMIVRSEEGGGGPLLIEGERAPPPNHPPPTHLTHHLTALPHTHTHTHNTHLSLDTGTRQDAGRPLTHPHDSPEKSDFTR